MDNILASSDVVTSAGGTLSGHLPLVGEKLSLLVEGMGGCVHASLVSIIDHQCCAHEKYALSRGGSCGRLRIINNLLVLSCATYLNLTH